MKIGSNKDINRDHKKLAMAPPSPKKAEGAAHAVVKIHLMKSPDKQIK